MRCPLKYQCNLPTESFHQIIFRLNTAIHYDHQQKPVLPKSVSFSHGVLETLMQHPSPRRRASGLINPNPWPVRRGVIYYPWPISFHRFKYARSLLINSRTQLCTNFIRYMVTNNNLIFVFFSQRMFLRLFFHQLCYCYPWFQYRTNLCIVGSCYKKLILFKSV